MIKKIVNLSFLIIILICTLSCEKDKLKMQIVGNNKSDTLIFDSKDTLITHGILDSIMLTSYASHEFTINNSKPIKFKLSNKDGILNTSKNEFILMDIEFASEGTEMDPMEIGKIEFSSYVLIDSFLICKKRFENELKDPIKLNMIIDTISVSKNGNYTTTDYERDYSSQYDETISAPFSGFKKIGSQNIFIEKVWDYDLNQKIPEEISVQTRSDAANNYVQKRNKTTIVIAKDFLKYATIMVSEYSVIDIKEHLKGKSKIK
ncbi:hypothetical protein [Flavobacterium branchiicola]|uniref:Lipoprotein n=1 Tax=Flavobacterium branchiicola TaxID=1114875 RepID=A0ABV9PAI3_9FLAO|nr:hypothetical protein [Flavobacterium branchiicola]MBS7253198.1 hypothetical protein [Flavobacterium branchiicola]